MAQERPVRVERRLSAILAADVAGYSRLMHHDEEATHAKLSALLTDAVAPAITEHGGRTVKNTGDGFLAEFSSPVEAVRAAVQFQARIKDLTSGEVEGRRIAFRVGINVGDVIVEPHDIFGDGVNIAARLESIAEPGGICISSWAYDYVQGKVGVEFVDLGDQDLKNISRPVRSYAVVWEDEPSQFTGRSCEKHRASSQRRPIDLGSGQKTTAHRNTSTLDQFSDPRRHDEDTELVDRNLPPPARGAGRLLDHLRARFRVARGVIITVVAVGGLVIGSVGYWTIEKPKEATFNASASRSMPRDPTIKPVFSRGPTVLIQPLANNTGDLRYDAVASNLTGHLITSMAKFSTLRVVERSVTEPKTTIDSAEPARQLSAHYVVGGRLRASANGTIVNIQLSDALTTSSVWSKNFEVGSEIVSSASVQDEIAGQAATLIGGFPGAIVTAEYKRVQTKPAHELSSYECIVQGVLAGTIGTHSVVSRARECLDRVTREEPANPFAWAALSGVLLNQRSFGFALPQHEARSIEKRLYLSEAILKASLRAAELAPDDVFVRVRLAIGYFANCQTDLLQYEAEKAIALNPYDAYAIGSLGLGLAFSGQWDVGAGMAEKAIRLMGASAPNLWWYAPAKRHWFRGEYQEAYNAFRRGYVERLWLSHFNMAYTLASLDRLDEAKAHVAKLLELEPGFTIREADLFFRTYCIELSYREKMAGALRKAGLPEE
jgi:adenylate cyclase